MTPVDAVSFVKRYRPDSVIKWNSNWLIHKCIIDLFEPHHANGDSNPSAGIYAPTGRYNCFSYSDRSISFKQLCKIIGKDYDYEYEEDLPEDFKKSLHDKLYGNEEDVSLDLSIYSSIHHEYMTDERHFSDDVLDAAKIKYDQFSNRILIPIIENGKVIAVQRRRINEYGPDGEWQPKYENTKGFDKSQHLYHIKELDISKPLFVFESVMSVLRAWDYGFHNSCATFGSRLSNAQIEKLKPFDTIILWFDGDESGQHGIPRAIDALSNHNLFIVDATKYGSKDIADLPKKTSFRLICEAKSPFDWKLSRHS